MRTIVIMLMLVSSLNALVNSAAAQVSRSFPYDAAIVDEMSETERTRGITSPGIYARFFEEIEDRRRALQQALDKCDAEGKTVAGFGASTTTTTLLYHFELGSRLAFIVDDNPKKHFLFSPGYHIPIRPPEDLYSRRPD